MASFTESKRDILSANMFSTPGMCLQERVMSYLTHNQKSSRTQGIRAELREVDLFKAATVDMLSERMRTCEPAKFGPHRDKAIKTIANYNSLICFPTNSGQSRPQFT